MPLVLDTKISRKLTDGRKVVFALHADPNNSNLSDEERNYQCFINVFNTNGVEIDGAFLRVFSVKKFHDCHYDNFIRKFCRDEEYRERFRTFMGY